MARIMKKNQLDRVRRKRHPVISLDQEDATTAERLELPDESSNPERLVLHDELDHPYHTALESLQPVHRATVMLCDLEGATYEEAAREEQCPVGTIRSRLHRAHKAIRGFLSRITETDEEPVVPRAHSRRAFLQWGTAAAAGAALGQLPAPAAAEAGLLHVLVWSDGSAPSSVYPDDVNGAIAAALKTERGLDVRLASLHDPEQGLGEAQLAGTDVLVWWADAHQSELSPERVKAVAERVREGMGLVALHSAVGAGLLPELLQTSCAWEGSANLHVDFEVTPAAPRHPIAQGLQSFRIARTSAPAGALDAPKPDLVIFDGERSSGERVWQGMVWTRGRGRIFYFQPGHPDYPIYHQEEVRQVLRNAVRWCGKALPVPER
jgi:trehalose utilization protein